MKLSSSDGDLDFVNKKKKQIWFSIVTRRQQQGEIHGWIQELELYHVCFSIYFMISLGQFELFFGRLGTTSEETEK